MRVVILFLVLSALAWADNFKLYLTDGTFHVVNRYEVLADRVRYYSIERSEWEELPREMVDVKKTEAERQTRQESEKKQAAFDDAEEKYERERRHEIERIPVDPGLYGVRNDKVQAFPVAEVKSLTDKKRSVLKAMSPVPLIAGKASLEIAGESARESVEGPTPRFYFRFATADRFSFVRLKPRKQARQVAVLSVEPVSKLGALDMDLVDTFRQQLTDDLYKVWPSKPLAPGEYALVQYSEGEVQIQVWDFRVVEQPAGRKN